MVNCSPRPHARLLACWDFEGMDTITGYCNRLARLLVSLLPLFRLDEKYLSLLVNWKQLGWVAGIPVFPRSPECLQHDNRDGMLWDEARLLAFHVARGVGVVEEFFPCESDGRTFCPNLIFYRRCSDGGPWSRRPWWSCVASPRSTEGRFGRLLLSSCGTSVCRRPLAAVAVSYLSPWRCLQRPSSDLESCLGGGLCFLGHDEYYSRRLRGEPPRISGQPLNQA